MLLKNKQLGILPKEFQLHNKNNSINTAISKTSKYRGTSCSYKKKNNTNETEKRSEKNAVNIKTLLKALHKKSSAFLFVYLIQVL